MSLNERNDYLLEQLNKNQGYYFRSQKVFYTGKSQFQNIEVHEFADYGMALRLDNVFQTSDRDEFLYHEPLAHVAGISMNGPRRGLVIGGGDGGMAEELLKYNTMQEVVMVELDKDVVDLSIEYLPQISNGAFNDSRLKLLIEDGINYIETCTEKFDIVILDLTDPFGPSVALYTKEFYQSIANILTENGALTLHIESPITRRKQFQRLFWTLKSVFKNVTPMLNYVPLYGTLWGYAMASQNLDPKKLDKEEVAQRMKTLNLGQMQYYNADTHFGIMAIPNYIQALLDEQQPPYTKSETVNLHKDEELPLCISEKK